MQLVHSNKQEPEIREWGEDQTLKDSAQGGKTHASAFTVCQNQEQTSKTELQTFGTQAAALEKEIQEAKLEQSFMLDFFNELLMAEQGQQLTVKKMRRRTPNDTLQRFECSRCGKIYTSDSSLKRHFRLKHDQLGDDPPEKRLTLHPDPDQKAPADFSEDDSLFEVPTTRINLSKPSKPRKNEGPW